VSVSNNSIADDESEASAGADRLGLKKTFEQMRLHVRRNAGAVVHDFNDNLVVFEAGANTDFSGSIDRVNGVVDEIGPDLIQFAAVFFVAPIWTSRSRSTARNTSGSSSMVQITGLFMVRRAVKCSPQFLRSRA